MRSTYRFRYRSLGASAKKAFAALAVLALCLTLSGCFADDIKKLEIGEIDPASVKDGTYEASQENDPITAKVQVEVKSGRMEAIRLIDHSHGPKKGADAIVERVLASQSLKVDSISGATLSSKVVLKAIEKALEKGKQGA
jgi:uncharacterized protein with FMN-binding domain